MNVSMSRRSRCCVYVFSRRHGVSVSPPATAGFTNLGKEASAYLIYCETLHNYTVLSNLLGPGCTSWAYVELIGPMIPKEWTLCLVLDQSAVYRYLCCIDYYTLACHSTVVECGGLCLSNETVLQWTNFPGISRFNEPFEIQFDFGSSELRHK